MTGLVASPSSLSFVSKIAVDATWGCLTNDTETVLGIEAVFGTGAVFGIEADFGREATLALSRGNGGAYLRLIGVSIGGV